jgi:hypothetical protein
MILLALFLLPQGLTALASTSELSRLPQDAVCQEDAWIRRNDAEAGAKVYWPRQGWQALLGDEDGDGFFDSVPGVDALVWAPTAIVEQGRASPSPQDFLFSFTRSGLGYADGDLLRIDPKGGFLMSYAESDFLIALGISGGGFDLDAATLFEGELLFSVRDSLLGTTLGTVEDGDILALDISTQQVRRLYSEAEVQAFVDQATGQSHPIGAVTALAVHPETQSLLFCVQGPSSQDATVFRVESGGSRLPGWHEQDWLFQVSTELDALTFLPDGLDQPPVLSVSLPYYQVGDTITHRVRFGTPGGVGCGFVAAQPLWRSTQLGGVGFEYLHPGDHIFLRQWDSGATHATLLDSSGSLSYSWSVSSLPSASLGIHLWAQMVDMQSGALSNPMILSVKP